MHVMMYVWLLFPFAFPIFVYQTLLNFLFFLSSIFSTNQKDFCDQWSCGWLYYAALFDGANAFHVNIMAY